MNHPTTILSMGRLQRAALLLIAIACGNLILGSSGTMAATSPLPGPLVSVDWLHKHADAVQIVDVRDDPNSMGNDPKYAKANGKKYLVRSGGHIPDAIAVNFWTLRDKHKINGQTLDFQFPTLNEFQEIMRASQLKNVKPIVLAPTGDNAISLQEAAFLALELEVYGVPKDQIAILDGGTHAWIAAGYPVDVDLILPMESSHWTAKRSHPELVIDTHQAATASKHKAELLDARPLTQYIGLTRTRVIPKSGHIPGARMLPPAALYRQDTNGAWHFLTAKEYATALHELGLQKTDSAIVYCNTGQYAAGAWFILNRIMDEPQVREYAGSMYTWERLGEPVSSL